MPNSTVPAAATGLPIASPPATPPGVAPQITIGSRAFARLSTRLQELRAAEAPLTWREQDELAALSKILEGRRHG